jgi:hypothetical protein
MLSGHVKETSPEHHGAILNGPTKEFPLCRICQLESTVYRAVRAAVRRVDKASDEFSERPYVWTHKRILVIPIEVVSLAHITHRPVPASRQRES